MKNEMNNKITYHQEGDYLKEYKKGLYQQLLIDNKLFEHLVETNEESKSKVRLITNQIAKQEHINEYQKGKDALDWVCAMNNAQARAEEIVYKELIYV